MDVLIGLFGLSFPFIIIIFFVLISSVRVLNEYERAIIQRLGRVMPRPAGPGLILLLPILDKMTKVDLRTITMDVKPQDVITKDNVSLKVSAVIYYRVVDPVRAIIDIEDYSFATAQMAQTTLRSVAGQVDLDQLLNERETLSNRVQTILDEQTEPWGIKVTVVEIKQIDLPEVMQRAMARQAESERERRAKIIAAEGEFQSAAKLVEAAELMQQHPMALQMKFLQTLTEISSENSSTVVFPVPIDILSIFQKK